MADRRNSRASSRSRVTTQPTQASSTAQSPTSRGSRRSARITASQERESQRTLYSKPRNTRATSVDSNGSRISALSRGARKGAQKAKVEELATVLEDAPSHGEEEEQYIADHEAAELSDEHAVPLRTSGDTALDTSLGVLSQISGTTAYSHVEAQELDSEQMLDELDGLYSNSKRFLKRFAPADADADVIRDLHSDLLAKDNNIRRTFDRIWQALEPSLTVYLGSQKKYISTTSVLRSLFSIDAPGDFSRKIAGIQNRPDPVLFLANLAMFIRTILPSTSEEPVSWERLLHMDTDFPKLFLSGFAKPNVGRTSGYSNNLRPTFSLALEIRTQMAIQHLKRLQDEGQDVEALVSSLDDIFYARRPDGSIDVKGWDVDGLGSQTEIQPQFRDKIEARHERLKKLLYDATNASGEVEFDQLGNVFTWLDFLGIVVAWVQDRASEIESVMSLYSDVSSMEAKLREEIKEFAAQAKARRKSRRSHGAHSVHIGGIEALKNFTAEDFADLKDPNEQDLVDKTAPIVEIEHIDHLDDAVPDFSNTIDVSEEDDIDELPSVEQITRRSAATASINATQSTRRRLLEIEKLKKGKENLASSATQHNRASARGRLIDVQSGAEPVEWGADGFEPTQSSEAGPSYTQATQTSRKRQRDEDDEDPTEDEGFQNDNRVVDTERRRQLHSRKRYAVQDFSSERPQPSSSKIRETGRNTPASPQTWPAQRASQLPIASQDLAKRQARENVAAKKKTQTRGKNPWTAEEEQRLVESIGLYGCNWAVIRDLLDDQTGARIFKGRDNISIKDKARNLKMMFIKSYRMMPENFDQISLGTRLEGILIDQGFNPHP
ncbi:hypothetical protein EJ05DRAFT_497553 [Pseudovirgaria hyperparasitica]|uniref:Myb-like domain-containing protein n=1 Tax=Pseudovirgaria hyperparasitica TaxID=470096 RepID=A0A6A6WDS9_9PEZI|nr:uncharacterized protein EJ05DRAFT_497553 [Pseudovirgaria hyperparasitica]KAF2760982.1 hypothetical protein EJ05DRAFT_497553 [Pseudovirgaria hyperparasitica]